MFGSVNTPDPCLPWSLLQSIGRVKPFAKIFDISECRQAEQLVETVTRLHPSTAKKLLGYALATDRCLRNNLFKEISQ
jgi:hypothetical protein